MKTKLGESTIYKETYSPYVLDFIPRELSRKSLNFDFAANKVTGVDLWHAYEFSWLDQDGSPECAMLRVVVPATSKNICESKSLKLYLGSFAFERIKDIQVLVETIQRDLSHGVGETVDVQLLLVEGKELFPSIPKGYCIDPHSLRNPSFDYNPELLRTGSERREELLYSHHFRSLCPVTAQPDWASIYVMYRGDEIIPEDLHRYLVSFRRHQGFHESCCEQIFVDISKRCAPEELGVMCCFTRRGGLDINPIRSNSPGNRLQFVRNVRQ